jgi:C-terminal processing protease CtpA/Prc
MIRRVTCSLALALSISFGATATDEKGWLGLTFTVDTGGTADSPIVELIKIESVTPGSPAAKAGLAVDDIVTAVQGIAIPGAKMQELQAATKISVGQIVKLNIKHGEGQPHDISLISVAKPPGQ